MPTEAHPLSLQPDHSLLPEVDTLLFDPSFQLESSQQESPFNLRELLVGSPAAHGPSDPSFSSRHHSVGALEGPSPHDTLGPMDLFLDVMDWLTPAAYSEAPSPYEYGTDLTSCAAPA